MSNVIFSHDLPIPPGYAAYVPIILAQSSVESHTGDAETIDVTGSKVSLPRGFFSPGSTIRYTLYGYRAGTAGAVTILVTINNTTSATLAVPTNTAVDFKAVLTISQYGNMAQQKWSAEILTSATVLSAFDQGTGTVDVSAGAVIKAQMTVANASDDGYIENVRVEYWNIPE
jgi:hypothetical protein